MKRSTASQLLRLNSADSDKSLALSCATYDSDATLVEEKLPCYSENLPSYTPSLTKHGCLMMKTEMSTPLKPSKYRKWSPVEIEVDNTQIKLTRRYGTGGIVKRTTHYSLQFAEVGLALDYTRRTNCFRLRVESKQIVFQCPDRQIMLNWMTALEIAIGLALPLELRKLPEEIKKRRVRQRDFSANRASRGPEWNTSLAQWFENSSEITLVSQRLGRELSKWRPPRRQSRFSFRDFPQLLQDASWEGKEFIYNGRWAQVKNQQIELVK